jgi:hypothetical protein
VSSPLRPTRRLALGVLAAFALLGTGCGSPSVESKVDAHRKEIVTFIETVRGVESQLATAPSERSGWTPLAGPKVGPENTVVVVDTDFDKLRTDPQETHNDAPEWRTSASAHASTAHDLGVLVDRVRALPRNPPERGEAALGVLDRALGMMRSAAYVAVVRTDSVKNATSVGNRFTGSAWKGSVLVWELGKKAWIGAVNVEVSDGRTEVLHGGGTVTGQLNYTFNAEIDSSVQRALRSGASTKGRVGGSAR